MCNMNYIYKSLHSSSVSGTLVELLLRIETALWRFRSKFIGEIEVEDLTTDYNGFKQRRTPIFSLEKEPALTKNRSQLPRVLGDNLSRKWIWTVHSIRNLNGHRLRWSAALDRFFVFHSFRFGFYAVTIVYKVKIYNKSDSWPKYQFAETWAAPTKL